MSFVAKITVRCISGGSFMSLQIKFFLKFALRILSKIILIANKPKNHKILHVLLQIRPYNLSTYYKSSVKQKLQACLSRRLYFAFSNVLSE